MELRIQIDEATYGILAGLCHLYPRDMSIEEVAGRIVIQVAAAVGPAGGINGMKVIGEEELRNYPFLRLAYEKGMARANAVFPDPLVEGEEIA